MERDKLKELVEWKRAGNRKPLIIRGARQVGKTWLMKTFGEREYRKYVYVNFEKNRRLSTLFEGDLDINRILLGFRVEAGENIDPENTLLILDEIQEVPRAVTALKYFHEEAPEYHIIAAGSLLGMAIHAGVSFPVGNITFLDLSPMTFTEFLRAEGEDALVELLELQDWRAISAYRSRYTERLRQYYFVGGMPEAVQSFSTKHDPGEVRKIQRDILDTYELDFSKHAPVNLLPRIRMVWNSVPVQLAKENRKFKYGLIKKGSRAKDYEMALSWMTDCRQVSKVYRVSKPGFPLVAYTERDAFKLFLVDIGLLAAMGDLDERTLLEGNVIFTEFKGALTEQYVFQQLNGQGGFVTAYWSAERATAEVDFVIQYENRIIPVEVKAEENLRSKSLKVYREKFNPPLSLRVSMSDYKEQGRLINVPLYGLSRIKNIIDSING